MDRVLLAVDRMHFNVTEANKAEQGYRRVFISLVLMHFGAGVKNDIGKVILGQANPPVTVAAMLTAAEAVEADVAARNKDGSDLSSWLTKRKWLYFASDERRKDGGGENI